MGENKLYCAPASEALCKVLLSPDYSDFNATSLVVSFDVPDDEVWLVDANGDKQVYRVVPESRTWHHLVKVDKEEHE